MRTLPFMLSVSLMATAPALAQQRESFRLNRGSNELYDIHGRMISYMDMKTGVTLAISEDRHRITAKRRDGKILWSRSDYLEPQELLDSLNWEKPPAKARIFFFSPLPEGKPGTLDREYGHKNGLKGSLLYVHFSAEKAGSTMALISEKDGSIFVVGFN